jgi:hypothetical protein
MLISLLLAAQSAPATAPTPASDPKHELQINTQIDAAFIAAADLDHDGALSLPEFQRAMTARIDAAIAANPEAQKKIRPDQRQTVQEVIVALFKSFDANADGRVTLAEVDSYTRARALALGQSMGATPSPGPTPTGVATPPPAAR